MRWLLMLLILSISVTAMANPVCSVGKSKARADSHRDLSKDYKNNYVAIEMLLEENMKSFDEICRLPSSSTTNAILKDLSNSYYPNFVAILMLYEENEKSRKNLGRTTGQRSSQQNSKQQEPARDVPREPAKTYITTYQDVSTKGGTLRQFIEESAQQCRPQMAYIILNHDGTYTVQTLQPSWIDLTTAPIRE